MAEAARHRMQAQHNERLTLEPVFRLPDTPYPDWVVTTSFYCALHLVEAKLAELGVHAKDHSDRRVLIRRYLSAGDRDIRSLYEVLYSDCRRARYECGVAVEPPTISLRTAQDAVEVLKRIKARL